MNSVFATATGSAVSISPESLARARTTLSQATTYNDDANSTLESPLKSAKSGVPVPVDPEALKMIKRKFADYDDDSNPSRAKKAAEDDELDYSSLFRRAGSGKAIKISETALSAAKRTMGADENDSTADNKYDDADQPSTSFNSPMLAAMAPTSGAASSTMTTPLRSTPQLNGRRPRLQQPGGGGGNQFRSPFNSPFRPPIVASPNSISSPMLARPASVAGPATPATATASPLSRMCLTTPSTSPGVTPIASLSPNSRNFTIRVKVTERSGAVVGYGPNGEGRFCCWLSDESEHTTHHASNSTSTTPAPRLEAEAGGAAAEKIAASLQYGKVYVIQSARLSVRRPAHDNPRGIVLFFDERTQITEVSALPPHSHITRQRHRSSLLPLSDVKREGEIDMAGIVRAVCLSPGCSSPSPQSSKGGGGSTSPPPSDAIPSIDVTLVDQRAALTLTLPHEYHKVELKPGDLLLVYRASAKATNDPGCVRVSAVRGRTKLLLNPESEDGRLTALLNWSRCGQWAAVGGSTKMRSIASIGEKMKEEAEENGGETVFAAKAMVVNVDAADEPMIEECATCGGRLVKDTTPCNCANDRGIRRSLQLEVDISDGTGVIRATAGGSVAEALVGVAVTEAVGMLRWNRDEWRSQCRRVHYESRVFKLRRDSSTPTGLSIVEALPVPYAAYHTLISKKLNKKVILN